MRIAKLLEAKGHEVNTIAPGDSVGDVLAQLARHGIGALVVSTDGRQVEGIVSERDIVRQLHARGPDCLDGPVSELMVREVRTAGPEDEVESLMAVMTTNRIRHVPVVDAGVLVGIVSIGDVVKHRVDRLEDDNRALHDYINAR